jgi:tetratricopeptide (TPR) repeat protein
MVDADYSMKGFLFGVEKVDAPGFESYATLLSHVLSSQKRTWTEMSKDKPILTRFWLHPMALNPATVRVSESGRVALYDARVQILSETLLFDKDGFGGTGQADPISQRAAELLTRVYSRLETSAAAKPKSVYALLHGTIDIVTMCTLLRESAIDYAVLDELRRLPYRQLGGHKKIPSYFASVTGFVGRTVDDVRVTLTGGVMLRSRPTRLALDRFDDFVGRTLQREAEAFRISGYFARRISLTFNLAAQEPSGSADIELKKLTGLREVAAKHPAAAAKLFQDVVTKDPTDLDARIQLARAELDSGRNGEAREAIHRASILEPYDEQVRIVALDIALRSDPQLDLNSQDSRLRRALSMDYVQRMLSAHQAGDDKAAVNHATRAIQLWPENSEAFIGRASASFQGDNLDGPLRDVATAIALLRQAMTVDGEASIRPRLSLALVTSAAVRSMGPIRARLRALNGERVDVDLMLEEAKRAAEEAFEAVKLDPDQPLAAAMEVGARAILADFLQALDRPDVAQLIRARYLANLAVAKYPNFPRIYFARARLRLTENDPHGAIDDLNKAIVLNPKMAEAYGMRAAVHLELQQCDLAADDAKKQGALNYYKGPLFSTLSEGTARALAECRARQNADPFEKFLREDTQKFMKSQGIDFNKPPDFGDARKKKANRKK